MSRVLAGWSVCLSDILQAPVESLQTFSGCIAPTCTAFASAYFLCETLNKLSLVNRQARQPKTQMLRRVWETRDISGTQGWVLKHYAHACKMAWSQVVHRSRKPSIVNYSYFNYNTNCRYYVIIWRQICSFNRRHMANNKF